MKYEVVKYHPSLKDDILQLQTYLLGPNIATNSKYLAWKYEQNPYQDSTQVYVALSSGKVVGMRGFCGSNWEIGASRSKLSIPCASDAVVGPGHRGQGIFRLLNDASLKDLERMHHRYVLGLSSVPIVYATLSKEGWHGIGEYEMLQWDTPRNKWLQRTRQFGKELPLLAPGFRLLRSTIKAGPVQSSTPGREPFFDLDQRTNELSTNSETSVILEKMPHSEMMADLAARVGFDGRMRHVRDLAFYNWRFGNPLNEYRFLYLGNTQLEGYLVLQSSPRDSRGAINIIDWIASDERVCALMFRSAISFCAPRTLRIWSKTIAPWTKSLLIDAGFRQMPIWDKSIKLRPGPLIKFAPDENSAANFSSMSRQLLNIDNWDLFMSNSDYY